MRVVSIWMMVLVLCSGGPVVFGAQETAADPVEVAIGPEGLLALEQQGKITVRALRAWGRLPDKYIKLAQQLRQEAKLDLLGADLNKIKSWLDKEDPALANAKEGLRELVAYMEEGAHLQWSAPAADKPIPTGALVRQGGKRWTQEAVPAAAAVAQEIPAPAPSEPQQEPPAATAVAVAAAAVETAAAADGGEGIEFPINDQIAGTFRAKLVVDGVRKVKKEDERYFQERLPQVLPENPQVQKKETERFDRRGETLPVNEKFAAGSGGYDLYLAMAQIDQPITIRVEAPEEPPILLSDAQKKGSASYKVVGKSFLILKTDEARGNADTGYAENPDGTITWTPRRDGKTGLPVGPRVIGIYMAYRVQKSVGQNALGVLRLTYHRIGWVVVGMPGDLFGDGKALYAVGGETPVAGAGAAPNWAWPVAPAEKFDFELPPSTMKKKEMRLSEDMRHAAWVEGEEGRQRVVLNGMPGKWYDEVPLYRMNFSANGKSFCFEGRMGDKEIPVCNGVEGPPLDDIDLILQSENGAHNLVSGKSNGKDRVFVDGAQIRETEADLKWRAALADDGTAAWVEADRQARTERILTSAGYESPAYKSIIEWPRFIGERAELYYIAEKEDGQRYLVRNGEELKPSMGTGYKFTVTPDGAYYAYVAPCGDNIRCMVLNGKIGPNFSSIWYPALFNADGTRYAYVGYRDKKAFLALNEEEFRHDFGDVESILELTFSPDGHRWAAGFKLPSGEYVLLADGKEMARRRGTLRKIGFSPDGKRVAWVERGEDKKTWKLLLDGQEGPAVGEIYTDDPPQFSPDGKTLVYFHLDKERKFHVSVWGGEERVHDVIIPRASFKADAIDYLAIDGSRFRRESIPVR